MGGGDGRLISKTLHTTHESVKTVWYGGCIKMAGGKNHPFWKKRQKRKKKKNSSKGFTEEKNRSGKIL